MFTLTHLNLIAIIISYADLTGVAQWIRNKLGVRSMKPFDCSYCLTFWFTLAYNYSLTPCKTIYELTLGLSVSIVGGAFICAILSQVIVGLIKKVI